MWGSSPQLLAMLKRVLLSLMSTLLWALGIAASNVVSNVVNICKLDTVKRGPKERAQERAKERAQERAQERVQEIAHRANSKEITQKR